MLITEREVANELQGAMMATASVDCGMLWTDLEGRELPGGWRLRRLVRPEGRKAWFEAEGPYGKPALVSLTEALNDEEELLARLRAAVAFRHPNVVSVYDARLAWVGETPLVMAAMEPTDENLADVLRERALDAAEARQLLHALLQGLAAIHARRLTHGRMEAGSVLASGETVKLRSDCLRREGFGAGVAEDVRGVGRIVTQALTRRIPANEYDPALDLLPESMGRAARRALGGNATLEEVAALAGVRVTKATQPGAEKTVTMEPAKAAGDQKLTQMDLPLMSRRRPEPEADEVEEAEGEDRLRKWLETAAVLLRRGLNSGKGMIGKWNYHRRGAPWVIAAAVGLALATALMLHGWLHRDHAAIAANPKIVVQRATPAEIRAAHAKPAAAVATAAKVASGTKVWRVVAFTYRRRSEAEQKARDLGARYPQLQPGVLATRGGDYLVTVGGAMSRDDAMALRARVTRMGLPRDTYAQNFR